MDNRLVKLDRPNNSSAFSELLAKRNDPSSNLNPQTGLHPNTLANLPSNNPDNDYPRRNQQHAHQTRRAIQLLGLNLQLPSPNSRHNPHPRQHEKRPQIHPFP
jgi:hypothetical protein